MTKFILVGGYIQKAPDGGKAFRDELYNGVVSPKLLLCYFARPEDTWEKKFSEDKEFYKGAELEMARPQDFIGQLDRADVVYFAGGSEKRLVEQLPQGWAQKLAGKTVAGSSAGADMLAKYYYNLDHPGVEEGLGILPLKVLVHYRSDYNAPNIDWDKAEAELKAYKEDLPLVALREGEFRVFEQ